MSNPFTSGQEAFRAGQSESDNPYICGTTKMGSPKFSDAEAGAAWYAGWVSVKPARVASTKELAAADAVNVSRFRRKSNRHYK
jgi:hypothetical protein